MKLAQFVIPRLSRNVAMGFAGILGWVGYALAGEDRRVAYANLDIVFNDRISRREKRRIVRAAFQNIGRNLVNLFWSPRITKDNFRRFIEIDEAAADHARRQQAVGKGLIVICPHYGEWELMSLALGFAGLPYTTVAEPTKNPVIEETIGRLRSGSGHTVVHPRFAVLKLFKTLGRGGTVGVLVDVNARRGRGGVWLEFFGLPVFNSAAVAELALRTGAGIIFGYAEPIPGKRARVVVTAEIPVDRTGDHDHDVKATSQRCLDECAKLIRDKPDHWLWTYKRWKRRPAPEIGNFPFYSKYSVNT